MTLLAVPSTKTQFVQVFNRLGVALQHLPDDTGVAQRVYFDALSDLPIDAIEAGAAALMRESGRRFFPTTAEWRTAAERAYGSQLREAVQPAREEPWRFECHACEDTGWVNAITCPGDASCGRIKPHRAHTFTRVCGCRPTNRTYQRHQRFGAGA